MANQHSTPSRRTVIAASAALAAGTAVNLAAIVAKADADPIFAVIDRHRQAHGEWEAAFEREMALERELLGIRYRPDDDPRWFDTLERVDAAYEDMDAAAADMTNVQPITMAGVIALLDYIDAFNRGEIRVGKSHSEHFQWPNDMGDETVKNGFGNELVMPWSFWVMRNVQAALKDIVA